MALREIGLQNHVPRKPGVTYEEAIDQMEAPWTRFYEDMNFPIRDLLVGRRWLTQLKDSSQLEVMLHQILFLWTSRGRTGPGVYSSTGASRNALAEPYLTLSWPFAVILYGTWRWSHPLTGSHITDWCYVTVLNHFSPRGLRDRRRQRDAMWTLSIFITVFLTNVLKWQWDRWSTRRINYPTCKILWNKNQSVFFTKNCVCLFLSQVSQAYLQVLSMDRRIPTRSRRSHTDQWTGPKLRKRQTQFFCKNTLWFLIHISFYTFGNLSFASIIARIVTWLHELKVL